MNPFRNKLFQGSSWHLSRHCSPQGVLGSLSSSASGWQLPPSPSFASPSLTHAFKALNAQLLLKYANSQLLFAAFCDHYPLEIVMNASGGIKILLPEPHPSLLNQNLHEGGSFVLFLILFRQSALVVLTWVQGSCLKQLAQTNQPTYSVDVVKENWIIYNCSKGTVQSWYLSPCQNATITFIYFWHFLMGRWKHVNYRDCFSSSFRWFLCPVKQRLCGTSLFCCVWPVCSMDSAAEVAKRTDSTGILRRSHSLKWFARLSNPYQSQQGSFSYFLPCIGKNENC